MDEDEMSEEDMRKEVLSPSRSAVLVQRVPLPPASMDVSAFLSTPEGLPLSNPRLEIDETWLPGPHVIEMQGTPWSRNSCWVDSAEWEGFYLISLHDRGFWKWPFEEDRLDTPYESRVIDLQRCFAVRDSIHMLAPPAQVSQLLKGLREGYHSRLGMPQSQPVAKINDMEFPFVSSTCLYLQVISLLISTIAWNT